MIPRRVPSRHSRLATDTTAQPNAARRLTTLSANIRRPDLSPTSLPAQAQCPTRQLRLVHWRPRWPRNKTRKIPMRQKFPTFEASPLLIDLDAEDCRAVRPYEPLLDGTPHKSMKPRTFALKALNKDINQFNKKSLQLETRFAQVAANVFSPWRMSDFDVLSAALLGSQGDAPQLTRWPIKKDKYRRMLWDVLLQNGVQLSIRDNVTSVMQYMLRRQKLSWRTTPGHEDAAGFRRAIESTTNFEELERIITNTMQTSEGRELVSTAGKIVADRCQSFVRQPVKMSENAWRHLNAHILCFTNNLIINFRHRKLPPPVDLQNLASVLAAKCGIQLEPTRQGNGQAMSPWEQVWEQRARHTRIAGTAGSTAGQYTVPQAPDRPLPKHAERHVSVG
ncbi:uncharacterized protein B0I36DRAFT_312219 [Microdochium trichocladiopsis]|uniref:Uncharacterized protein n=1 Tax=Microdochium trichocladiopsis TaxID=1682393 RepID=A0A9P8YJK0_9PEZI|nr:uncharacterized protein B0I36DRAFT_312219 [Microdochium trichocladiopsis]KAH7041137.1 hypothetical protein B0I36DRAFT_312219 [Microdochium trichocladiopsis]